jgi:hypothetical protein
LSREEGAGTAPGKKVGGAVARRKTARGKPQSTEVAGRIGAMKEGVSGSPQSVSTDEFAMKPQSALACLQWLSRPSEPRSAAGGTSVVTVLDRVRGFVERLSPDAVCDDCISDRLGLSQRQHANHKSRELVGTAGFERQIGTCALCTATKKVIRAKAR